MPALIRIAAVVATATALTVAAPLAANAAQYPPTTPADWNAAACAGGTFTHTLPSGTFGASRTLRESVTGASKAVPTPATFLAAHTSYSLTSTSSGSAIIKLKFPSAASGSYNVSIAQQGGGKASYGAITVDAPGSGACVANPAVDPSTDPVAASATTGALATTGTHISEGLLGTALGAVLIGGVLAFVARRRRQPRRH